MLYFFGNYSIIGNMERERRKRLRTIKLVITEIIMVIAVIVTVILLTLVAMGYNVNRKGEVGQQGLVQVNSRPTGATINIDGEDLLSRTNASKLLSSGSHHIKLSKNNYDSWEKTVTIESGRLLMLDYPRLFRQGRVPEQVRNYEGVTLSFFEPAPNHDSIIYAEQGEKIWNWLDIRGDGAVDTELDFSEILAGLEVEKVDWNGDNDKVLVIARDAKNHSEWLVLNLRELKNSLNLTQELKLDFTKMVFATNSGDKIVSLSGDGDLRMIAVNEQKISQNIASKVVDFAINGDDLFYVTQDKVVYLYNESIGTIKIAEFPLEQSVKVNSFDYLGQKYLSLTADAKLTVYRGDYPNNERGLEAMTVVQEAELEMVPDVIRTEADGELLVAKNGRKVAVFDAEINKLSQFELKGEQLFFIDFYLMGTITEDNKLVICDFDGTNERELTRASGTALITKNGKWMYYLLAENGNTGIYREQIVE